MEVYYSVHCFHCDECKPQVKDSELNFFMCAKWLENKDSNFNQDELWDDMRDLELNRGNDTYMKFRDNNTTNKRYNSLISIWKSHFPIDTIKYYVSW